MGLSWLNPAKPVQRSCMPLFTSLFNGFKFKFQVLYAIYIGTMCDDAQSYLDKELWPFFLALLKSHLLNLEQTSWTSSNGTTFMNQHISYKLWHHSHHTFFGSFETSWRSIRINNICFFITAYNVVVISCSKSQMIQLVFVVRGSS